MQIDAGIESGVSRWRETTHGEDLLWLLGAAPCSPDDRMGKLHGYPAAQADRGCILVFRASTSLEAAPQHYLAVRPFGHEEDRDEVGRCCLAVRSCDGAVLHCPPPSGPERRRVRSAAGAPPQGESRGMRQGRRAGKN